MKPIINFEAIVMAADNEISPWQSSRDYCDHLNSPVEYRFANGNVY
jgi:hypothetical protein